MLSHRFCSIAFAITLASSASAQSITAFGLTNTPVGAATISYDPVARRLPINNIGSSGQDGVSIDLGRSYAAEVGWESLAGTPDGASVELRVNLNGLPPGTRYIGNLSVHTGNQWTISGTAAGLGVGGFSYLVLDHGQLTGRVTVPNNGTAIASAAPIGATAGPRFRPGSSGGSAGTPNCEPWEITQWRCTTSEGGDPCGVSWGAAPSAALSACCSSAGGTLTPTCGIHSFSGLRFAATTTITISGTAYLGDEILLSADVTGDEHPIDSVAVVASQFGPAGTPGTMTLNYMKIEWDNRVCSNLGSSATTPTTGATGERRLPVNNLGSSGQDGVEISWGRAVTWDVYMDPIDSGGSAPLGAYLDCVALGIKNGVDNQPLGSLRYRRGQGFFDVFADFSDIGSPTHRIVLLDHGAVVLDLPGHSGPVCTTSSWPFKLGKLGGALECFVACQPAGSQFLINGSAYVGDELRVLADAATASIGPKTTTQIRGLSLGTITMRGLLSTDSDLSNGAGFCAGDGSGTACPCGNAGAPGHGCANSVNAMGALVTASGIAKISADSLVLMGSGMPNSFALYFQGTGVSAGGAGTVFGDGLRCAAGSVLRLGTKLNALGTSAYPGGNNAAISVQGAVTSPGSRYYQIWYRNAAMFCSISTFNLTNGLQVVWIL